MTGTIAAWLRGGSGGFWSQESRAALVACGIEPDNYETLERRATAEHAIRRDYQERRCREAGSIPGRDHEPCCRAFPRKFVASLADCTCNYSTSARVFREVESLGMRITPSGIDRSGGWLVGIGELPRMTPNTFFGTFHLGHPRMTLGRHGQPSYGMHGAIACAENSLDASLDVRTRGGVRSSDIHVLRNGKISRTVDLGRSAVTGNPMLDGSARRHLQIVGRRRARRAPQVAIHSPNGCGGRAASDDAFEKAKRFIHEKYVEVDDAMRHDAVNTFSTVGRAIAKHNDERAKRGLSRLPLFSEMSRRQQQKWLRRAGAHERQIALEQLSAGGDEERLELEANVLAERMAKPWK